MAEALYRKYRPQVFDDVVGQEHIERTLKNAIDQDQVSHAYLFCGPRGTGKTTTARLLAKALLCATGPTSSPDGTCRECVDIANGVHPDVYELDAASRTGVDNVREEIIGRVNFAPTRGASKVYIIDEVHMLSQAAFNALLKTLEEPPGHVMFILCTTDPQKVPETIHSRCQRFDFHRLSTDEIVTRLGAICVAEGVEFEGDALDLIAHRAEGGMRNALTSLEQLIAFGEGSVTVKGAEDLLGSLDASDMAEIIHAVGTRDVARCFAWTANYVETGADLAQFARDMAEHVRNMYVLSLAGADAAIDVPDAVRRELVGELSMFGPDRLARLMGVLGDVIAQMRTSSNPRLCFEIALTRMVRPDSDLTLEALAERIEALESGVVVQAPAAVPAGAPVGNAQQGLEGGGATPAAATLGAAATRQTATDAGPATSAEPAIGAEPAAAEDPAPTPVAAGAQQPESAPEAQVADAGVQPAHDGAGAAGASQDPGGDGASKPEAAPSGLAAIVGNSAALQRTWRSAVTAVKKEKPAYGVLFLNVRARAADDGQGIVLEFPADNPFAFGMAQKPEVSRMLSQALDNAAGTAVPYTCVQVESPIPPTRTQVQATGGHSSAAAGGQAGAAANGAGHEQVYEQAPALGQAPEQASALGQAHGQAPEPGQYAEPALELDMPPEPVSNATVSVGFDEYSDSVPLDVYDNALPAAGADDAFGFADDSADSALPPEPGGAEPAEGSMDAADLSRMLSDTMGGSIVFEEVDG